LEISFEPGVEAGVVFTFERCAFFRQAMSHGGRKKGEDVEDAFCSASAERATLSIRVDVKEIQQLFND
jgi:hypothetical protein